MSTRHDSYNIIILILQSVDPIYPNLGLTSSGQPAPTTYEPPQPVPAQQELVLIISKSCLSYYYLIISRTQQQSFQGTIIG